MYKLLKLNFTAPLHLGEAGIGLEETGIYAHSDTVYSAICNAWSQLYGSKSLEEELILQFLKEKAPFKISSAFLFNDDVYFLPKPMMKYKGINELENSQELLKLIKKTQFIPLKIFIKWVSGHRVEENEYLELRRYKNNILEKAYYRYDASRVQIDRMTSNGALFHCSLVRYTENAGLYLILNIVREKIKDKLKQVIAYLGELGLGGQLSNGCGKFKAEWFSLGKSFKKLFHPDFKTDSYCILSLYNPCNEEINNITSGAAYKLLMRKGWVYSRAIEKDFRRKNCRMFKEGSVFNKKTKGRIIDVTPDNYNPVHKIYRFGISLDVPIKRGGNNAI